MAATRVRLTAVVAQAWISAGQLAEFAPADTLEIAASAGANHLVCLKVADQPVAIAELRHLNGCLVAKIITMGCDAEMSESAEWRFVREAGGGP
jgi:hypothetical protein